MYEGDKKDLTSNNNLCGRVTNPDLVSVTGSKHERLNSIEDSETSDN